MKTESTSHLLSQIFTTPLDGSTELALALDDVTVRFGGVQALRAVSFDIKPNEIVAVVGPNGAGKSTLLNTISGLSKGANSGQVRICGHSVLGKRGAVIARVGVGRSFQDPPLIEAATVLENVIGGGHTLLKYRMDHQIWRRGLVRRLEAEMDARARAVLEFVGIGELTFERAGSLPYGKRKLVDVARAMVTGPKLLLLDEPTSGLDASEQESVRQILIKLGDSKLVTVVLVEHHMDLVRAAASTVVALQGGSMIAVGTPTEVFDSEDFRNAIIGGSESGDRSAPYAQLCHEGAAVCE